MQINQIAAQLYTVREFLKTPGEIAASLRRIRGIGYEAVQVGALDPIDDAELAAMLDGEGLTCCATHEPTGNILDRPEAVVERLTRLGATYTALPYPTDIALTTLADVHNFAARINRAGQVLFDAGRILTYHNHQVEFRRIEGWSVLETIYAETDPNFLQGELDTYWIQFGGGDPIDWCRRLQDRLPLIHLKDYVVDNQNKVTYCEVGYGNLNWPEIIPAAAQAGCRWFIVEQDTCPGDSFESLKMSFDFLRENFAR